MVKVKIADQSHAIQEVNYEWIRSSINKNRVMGNQDCVEIDIDSENVKLKLFANCGQPEETKATNEIESRIIFLWNELVLSKEDLDTRSLYDFLKRMDKWVSFVPT